MSIVNMSSKDFTVLDKGHVVRDFKFRCTSLPQLTDDQWFMVLGALDCDHCGEDFGYDGFTIDVETNVLTILGDECKYPQGLTSTVDLDVPSGKMVAANVLRPVFQVEEKFEVGLSSAYGRHKMTKAYEEQGMVNLFVSNTSPSLYRTGADRFVMANVDDDYIYSSEEDAAKDIQEQISGWEEVGNIITDVWAYEIADYDLFVSRGGKPEELSNSFVVDVEPGTYRFVHHEGEVGFDWGSDEPVLLFTEIEKVNKSIKDEA